MLKYRIRIAIIGIICFLIGKGLFWYAGRYHYGKTISFIYNIADLVMSDEEYRDFLEHQIEVHNKNIATIDAALATSGASLQITDKPASGSKTPEDGKEDTSSAGFER